MCVYDILVVLTTLHFCVIIPRASAAFYYAQRARGKNTKTNYTEIKKKCVYENGTKKTCAEINLLYSIRCRCSIFLL